MLEEKRGIMMKLFDQEDPYGLPMQLNPNMALLQKYPTLSIDSDYITNTCDYKIDKTIIYKVHFMQQANFELYRNIEEAIEKHLAEAIEKHIQEVEEIIDNESKT